MDKIRWVVEMWVPGEVKAYAPRRRNGEPNRYPGRWVLAGIGRTEREAREFAQQIHFRTRVRRSVDK